MTFFMIYKCAMASVTQHRLNQYCNESFPCTNFSFLIQDICAPVQSLMRTNMAVSHKQRNLSILLAVLALE